MKHVLSAIALLLACTTASAGILIGNYDNLQRLMPVEMKGKEGEALALGFRTTRVVFGLGIYVKNQGYVLMPADGNATYYPLEPELLKELQDAGSLPKELPDHWLPLSEYALGYSLWWAIALVAAYIRFDEIRKKKAVAASTNSDA